MPPHKSVVNELVDNGFVGRYRPDESSITRRGHEIRSERNGRGRPVKYRDVEGVLRDQGFECVRQRGSHRRFEAVVDGTRQTVTLAGKANDDVTKGTLAAIGRQSGLPARLFRP